MREFTVSSLCHDENRTRFEFRVSFFSNTTNGSMQAFVYLQPLLFKENLRTM
jgi:hypothetical protein